jgi:hypothetical protein
MRLLFAASIAVSIAASIAVSGCRLIRQGRRRYPIVRIEGLGIEELRD